MEKEEAKPQPTEENKTEDQYQTTTSIFAASSTNITSEQCAELAEMLQQYPLPGISSKEQIYLIAIIETISQMLQEGKSFVDKCGIKFVLMTRIFNYMTKSLPPAQRPKRLSWLEMALQADVHSLLVKQILPSDALWPTVRALGIPLWVTEHATLSTVAKILAKTHYSIQKVPSGKKI